MGEQLPSLDALVLRGATIDVAVGQLGLRDAWDAGECFLLRGRMVQRHAVVPVPLRGRIRVTPTARHSLHVRLGLRLAPGSSVVDESLHPHRPDRRLEFPTRERVDELSRDARLLALLKQARKTLEDELANQAMPVDPSLLLHPEGLWFAYDATEPWLQLVVLSGDSDQLLGNVGLSVEHHGSHELTVGMAAPEAPVPRFDAFVLRLFVEPMPG